MNKKIKLEDLPVADMIAYIEAFPPSLPYGSLTGVPSSPAAGGLLPGQGTAIASAATINVTHQFHVVTGGVNVASIFINGAAPTLSLIGTQVTLEAVGNLTLVSTGNILATGAAGTRVVPSQAAITLVFSASSGAWIVAGVGS